MEIQNTDLLKQFSQLKGGVKKVKGFKEIEQKIDTLNEAMSSLDTILSVTDYDRILYGIKDVIQSSNNDSELEGKFENMVLKIS